MSYKSVVLVLLMCGASLQGVSAKIYSWQDQDGVMHFGEQIPTQYLNPTAPQAAQTIVPVAQPMISREHCQQAIANGHYGLQLLHKDLTENINRGVINQREYTQAAVRFAGFNAKLTMALCATAKAVERDFYLCNADFQNHTLICFDKYEKNNAG